MCARDDAGTVSRQTNEREIERPTAVGGSSQLAGGGSTCLGSVWTDGATRRIIATGRKVLSFPSLQINPFRLVPFRILLARLCVSVDFYPFLDYFLLLAVKKRQNPEHEGAVLWSEFARSAHIKRSKKGTPLIDAMICAFAAAAPLGFASPFALQQSAPALPRTTRPRLQDVATASKPPDFRFEKSAVCTADILLE